MQAQSKSGNGREGDLRIRHSLYNFGLCLVYSLQVTSILSVVLQSVSLKSWKPLTHWLVIQDEPSVVFVCNALLSKNSASTKTTMCRSS